MCAGVRRTPATRTLRTVRHLQICRVGRTVAAFHAPTVWAARASPVPTCSTAFADQATDTSKSACPHHLPMFPRLPSGVLYSHEEILCRVARNQAEPRQMAIALRGVQQHVLRLLRETSLVSEDRCTGVHRLMVHTDLIHQRYGRSTTSRRKRRNRRRLVTRRPKSSMHARESDQTRLAAADRTVLLPKILDQLAAL
jgi:hypothetical protein